jgi:hypothetical protein
LDTGHVQLSTTSCYVILKFRGWGGLLCVLDGITNWTAPFCRACAAVFRPEGAPHTSPWHRLGSCQREISSPERAKQRVNSLHLFLPLQGDRYLIPMFPGAHRGNVRSPNADGDFRTGRFTSISARKKDKSNRWILDSSQSVVLGTRWKSQFRMAAEARSKQVRRKKPYFRTAACRSSRSPRILLTRLRGFRLRLLTNWKSPNRTHLTLLISCRNRTAAGSFPRPTQTRSFVSSRSPALACQTDRTTPLFNESNEASSEC